MDSSISCEGVGCRKRARSEPDDCEECMPISKRINNLHIRHSTDSREELEQRNDQSFSNNLPSGTANCQFSPQSVASCSNPRHMSSVQGQRTVQIPGLAMGPMTHYQPGYTIPDINHNNPLLSPMPRQPCPSSITASQQTCNNCNLYPYQPSIEKNDSYYFQINSRLYQAHMERLYRLQEGGHPNT